MFKMCYLTYFIGLAKFNKIDKVVDYLSNSDFLLIFWNNNLLI